MITFKEFLTEMPRRLGHFEKPENQHRSDLNRSLEDTIGTTNMKHVTPLSTLDKDHDLHRYQNGGDVRIYVTEKTSGLVKGKILGYHNTDQKRFDVEYTERHHTGKFKMRDVYSHLLDHHYHTIRSDIKHSAGSEKMYKSLSDDPRYNIKVRHAYNSDKKMTTYHGPQFHLNYGLGDNAESQFEVSRKK